MDSVNIETTNTVGDFLRSQFSTLVNKDGKIFKALIANPKGDGTLEQIFKDVETARDEWCNNYDFYEQSGEKLEKTMSFFSFLERLYGESDESLKRRNEFLFCRNGATKWGDVWNIRNIFQQYFNNKYVYIVNNTNHINENLLLDGDFEMRNSWVLDGCAYDKDAGFSEWTGVKFDDQGTCTQTVKVNPDSTYFLHFFLEGEIAVKVKDNKGRYWDRCTGEFGSWVTPETGAEFKAKTWDAKSLFFLTDNDVSSVTVTFIGLCNHSAFLDYVRLFLKEPYSTFTLIAVFNGIYKEDTLGFAPGKDDYLESDLEEKTINYEIMSYLDNSHIIGVEGSIEKAKDVYTELLEMVGAGGITSYIEIITRELD